MIHNGTYYDRSNGSGNWTAPRGTEIHKASLLVLHVFHKFFGPWVFLTVCFDPIHIPLPSTLCSSSSRSTHCPTYPSLYSFWKKPWRPICAAKKDSWDLWSSTGTWLTYQGLHYYRNKLYVHLPSPCWDLVWLCLTQVSCMLLQSLWVYMCRYSTVSIILFHVVIYCLWLLCLFCNDPRSLGIHDIHLGMSDLQSFILCTLASCG